MEQHLVIITGHSSGLGEALLHLALRDQASVIGLARRKNSATHRQLQQIQVDLESPELNLEQLFLPLEKFLNGPWKTVSLINNAGTMQPVGLIGLLDSERIASSLYLTLIRPLQLTNWLVKRFPETSLRLVQISSGASKKAYAGWAAYCTSKAGLRMQAQVFAAEAADSGQDRRVVIYEPGVIDTPMQADLRAVAPDQFPSLERFRDLHAKGQLVSAEASAQELWGHLKRSDLPPLLETRFGSI